MPRLLLRRGDDADLLPLLGHVAHLPRALELLEERCGGWVAGIDAEAEQLVAVAGAAVLPGAGDADRVLRDAAEALAQLLGGLVELFRLDERAVVLVQR